MGKKKSKQPIKRRRTRVDSTITRAPKEIQDLIDGMLLDNSNTFTEIAARTVEMGHPISRSAIGRYSLRVGEAARRISDSLEKTMAIIRAVENSPDVDYTKASRIMLMDGLLQKVSMAEEEFLEMPLDKAGRLILGISQTELNHEKARQEYQNKMQLALDGLELELGEAIKANPELSKEFQAVMEKARKQLFAEEE